MKKIVLTAITLLAAMTSTAQNESGTWSIIPKIGLNFSTMTQADLYYEDMKKAEPRTRRGFALGVEAEYRRNVAALSAGVIYSQQGCNYADMDGAFKNMETRLDYINIPVMAHFHIAPGLAIKAGIQPGFAVRRNQKGEEFTMETRPDGATWSGYKAFSYDKSFYRTFDYTIPVGVSYDLDNLRIECRYNFTPHDATKYDLHEKNRYWQVTLGYRFEL